MKEKSLFHHSVLKHVEFSFIKLKLYLAVHGGMGCSQKSFKLVWRCAPVRISGQSPLAPSVTSVANDKCDNEMIPGAVHRSPGICLKAEEILRKPQLGDHLIKGLCDLS